VAYYTIKKKYITVPNPAYQTQLIYNNINAIADFWFIKTPPLFVFDAINILNTVPLSVPQEYHPQICSIAAEILNDIDVGEGERGDVVFQNQRLTIEGVGG
jgi:hypothetical protein